MELENGREPSPSASDSTPVLSLLHVRPLLPSEQAAGCCCIVSPLPNECVQVQGRQYAFDCVVGEGGHSPRHMCDQYIRPLVRNVCSGVNCAVFAYGQTGSGKTHTMGLCREQLIALSGGEGSNTAGTADMVIPYALRQLFDNVEAARGKRTFTILVSFVEVYMEKYYDLLAQRASVAAKTSCEGEVILVGATLRQVGCMEEVVRLLQLGGAARITKGTSQNDRSSRSHAVLTVHVQSRAAAQAQHEPDSAACSTPVRGSPVRGGSATAPGGGGGNSPTAPAAAVASPTPGTPSPARACAPVVCGGDVDATAAALSAALAAPPLSAKLHLVDLAGSESVGRAGTIGLAAKEGNNINLSLMTLRNLIQLLAAPKAPGAPGPRPVLPYRDSKLTTLLRDALGGNSSTLFIACVSPADACAATTVSTLEFATTARRIRTKPAVNIGGAGSSEVLELHRIIHKLRGELEQMRRQVAIASPSPRSPESLSSTAGALTPHDDLSPFPSIAASGATPYAACASGATPQAAAGDADHGDRTEACRIASSSPVLPSGGTLHLHIHQHAKHPRREQRRETAPTPRLHRRQGSCPVAGRHQHLYPASAGEHRGSAREVATPASSQRDDCASVLSPADLSGGPRECGHGAGPRPCGLAATGDALARCEQAGSLSAAQGPAVGAPQEARRPPRGPVGRWSAPGGDTPPTRCCESDEEGDAAPGCGLAVVASSPGRRRACCSRPSDGHAQVTGSSRDDSATHVGDDSERAGASLPSRVRGGDSGGSRYTDNNRMGLCLGWQGGATQLAERVELLEGENDMLREQVAYLSSLVSDLRSQLSEATAAAAAAAAATAAPSRPCTPTTSRRRRSGCGGIDLLDPAWNLAAALEARSARSPERSDQEAEVQGCAAVKDSDLPPRAAAAAESSSTAKKGSCVSRLSFDALGEQPGQESKQERGSQHRRPGVEARVDDTGACGVEVVVLTPVDKATICAGGSDATGTEGSPDGLALRSPFAAAQECSVVDTDGEDATASHKPLSDASSEPEAVMVGAFSSSSASQEAHSSSECARPTRAQPLSHTELSCEKPRALFSWIGEQVAATEARLASQQAQLRQLLTEQGLGTAAGAGSSRPLPSREALRAYAAQQVAGLEAELAERQRHSAGGTGCAAAAADEETEPPGTEDARRVELLRGRLASIRELQRALQTSEELEASLELQREAQVLIGVYAGLRRGEAGEAGGAEPDPPVASAAAAVTAAELELRSLRRQRRLKVIKDAAVAREKLREIESLPGPPTPLMCCVLCSAPSSSGGVSAASACTSVPACASASASASLTLSRQTSLARSCGGASTSAPSPRGTSGSVPPGFVWMDAGEDGLCCCEELQPPELERQPSCAAGGGGGAAGGGAAGCGGQPQAPPPSGGSHSGASVFAQLLPSLSTSGTWRRSGSREQQPPQPPPQLKHSFSSRPSQGQLAGTSRPLMLQLSQVGPWLDLLLEYENRVQQYSRVLKGALQEREAVYLQLQEVERELSWATAASAAEPAHHAHGTGHSSDDACAAAAASRSSLGGICNVGEAQNNGSTDGGASFNGWVPESAAGAGTTESPTHRRPEVAVLVARQTSLQKRLEALCTEVASLQLAIVEAQEEAEEAGAAVTGPGACGSSAASARDDWWFCVPSLALARPALRLLLERAARYRGAFHDAVERGDALEFQVSELELQCQEVEARLAAHEQELAATRAAALAAVTAAKAAAGGRHSV